MSVRIIVDSGTDLPEAICSRVEVLPLTVRFGQKEYADRVDLSPREFYQKLTEGTEFPTTSQITPLAFTQVFQRVKQAGDTAVVITLSSALSGTYQSALIAAADYTDCIWVVDSKNVAIGGGILARLAVDMAQKGQSACEIARELVEMRDKVCLFAVVDTLEYLKKGGRISASVALAGGLLNIKPILGICDGKVEMLGKARGMKQACLVMDRLAEEAGADLTLPYLLGYTGVTEQALQRYMESRADKWGESPDFTVVGSAIGTHAGPNAVAVAFFKK